MTAASRAVPLDRLPVRMPARVVSVPVASQVADVGLVAGVEVAVERVLPLGGPVIVRLGAARVALARVVARSILVQEEERP